MVNFEQEKKIQFEITSFDIVKEIKNIPIVDVVEFCEATGGTLDVKKQIVHIARVFLR